MPCQTRPIVLQLLPRLMTGGVERGTIDIALALQAAGHIPLVVSYGGPMVSELEQAGIEHITMPVHSKNPFRMHFNAEQLVHIIKERKINIIHARSRAPAWSAAEAASRTGIAFLTTFHGTYTLGPFAIKKPYNRIMTRGNRVIAISNFIAMHLQKVYGITSERISIIPRGIDNSNFNLTSVHPSRVASLARRWCLSENQRIVILPGRLVKWKGHEILIEALAKVNQRNLCCLFIGFDQEHIHYRTKLEELICQRGLERTIHWVGFCADMPAAYMLADVVVSASTEPEAFGRVVVEAQAMGRPVIATDHGGSRETIVHGRTGLLVQPRNSDALAKALVKLLTLTAAERHAMAVRQVDHVHAQFSKEMMCARTLSLYQKILNNTV